MYNYCKEKLKQFLSFCLSCAIVLSLFPTISFAADVEGWTLKNYSGQVGSIEIDHNTYYEGNGSMKIISKTPNTSGVYMEISQSVPLVAGKEYTFRAASKGNDVNILVARFDREASFSLAPFGGNFEWMEYEGTLVPQQTKSYMLWIWVQGTCKSAWVDSIELIDNETGENLIKNGTFDVPNYVKPEESGEEGEGSEPEVSRYAEYDEIYKRVSESETFSADDYFTVSGRMSAIPFFRASGLKMDGDPSDWENIRAIRLPTTDKHYSDLNRKKSVDEFLTGEAKFAFDDTYFYSMISVKDDVNYVMHAENSWAADGVQMTFANLVDVYGKEVNFSVNPETGEGAAWGNAFVVSQKERMLIEGSRNGDITTYEIAIPWEEAFGSIPDAFLYDFVVNDNDDDGAGRTHCLQLAPGISSGKSAVEFPMFIPIKSDYDWYTWIETIGESAVDEENEYSIVIMNTGSEKTFTIKSLFTDDVFEVVVPENTCVRRNVKKLFTEPGSIKLQAEVATENGEKYTTSITVSADKKTPDAEGTRKIIEKMNAWADELEELMDQCDQYGISTDYERMQYNLVKRFPVYLADDIEHNDFSRVNYTERTIKALYEEAKDNMLKYLSGEKESQPVPKYITSTMDVDGTTVYALTETNGVQEVRPYTYIGYGHFNVAAEDMDLFNQIGISCIQYSVTPGMVENTGWALHGTGGNTLGFECITDDVYSGDYAMKLTFSGAQTANVYGDITEVVEVEGGKTYELKFRAKAKNATGVTFSPNNYADRISMNGTYDWKEFKTEITYPAGTTHAVMRVILDSTTESFIIDDITLCEKGTNKNVIVDGGFEDFTTGKVWKLKKDGEDFQDVLDVLRRAEEKNIAVSLLLSPHIVPTYFTGFTGSSAPENLDMKYVPHHQGHRNMYEAYVRDVIEEVKDFKSLNNICLSNEPQMHADKCGDFYLEDWHEFLKERYDNNIKDLNEAYGTSYTAFEEVDFSREENTKPLAKNYDLKQFNDMIFADWHKITADVIKEIAPDIPLNAKVVGYVTDNGDLGGYRDVGTGYENFAEFLDLNGCDFWAYLTDARAPYCKFVWYDYMTSLKDAPVLNTEDHIIPDRDTNYAPIVSDYVSMDMYQGAIHGRYFSTIWLYQRSYDKNTNGWGCIQIRPDSMAKISKAAMDLNRNAYEIDALKNEIPEVGILYCDPSMYYDPAAMNSAGRAYAAAIFNGKRVGYVVDAQLEKIHDYKLMIVPNAMNVTEESLLALKDYIDNGGYVIILGKNSLYKNERNLDNDKELVDYIRARSKVIDYEGTNQGMTKPTYSEFYSEIRESLKELGLYYISVIDMESGKPVEDVEYNIASYDGNVIVNLCNYVEEEKKVKIFVGNNEITSALELRSNEVVSDIVLKQYVPQTFKISGQNVFFDTYGSWGEQNIVDLYNAGVVSGVSQSRFAPKNTVTRAEFAALLLRGAGVKYTDGGNNWYDGAVAKAKEIGLVKQDEDFRPTDYITREEMCYMIARCYENKIGSMDTSNAKKFTDSNSISYVEDVNKVSSTGIVSGYEDGTFRPKNNLTREEAAAVVARYMNLNK